MKNIFKDLFKTKKVKKEKTCVHCEKKSIARGYCYRHYKSWSRHGDALHTDISASNYCKPSQREKYLYKGATPVHRIVMEKHIGRKISKHEIVHHIDLDTKNNDISNLYLCSSRKEHGQCHYSLQLAAEHLIRKGYIKFEDGEYGLYI